MLSGTADYAATTWNVQVSWPQRPHWGVTRAVSRTLKSVGEIKPPWLNFCRVLLLFRILLKQEVFFNEEGGDCFSDRYYIRNEYRKSVKGLATACVFPTNMARCGLVKELP